MGLHRPIRRSKAPELYDFLLPKRLHRDQARALQIFAESFARQWTTLLSMSLRAVSQVSVGEIEQTTYADYLDKIPTPAYLAVIGLPPLPGTSVLHLPLPVVMTSIDRLVGGPGSLAQPSRPVTEIEAKLLQTMLTRVLAELANSMASLIEVDATHLGHETNPQFAQIAAPQDVVVYIEFELRVAASRGTASLCVPLKSLQPAFEELAAKGVDGRERTNDEAGLQQALETRIGEALLPISVRFRDVVLSTGELASLRPGQLMNLHHHISAPLHVAISGVNRLEATAGRRHTRLACVIVEPAGTAGPKRAFGSTAEPDGFR